MQNLEINKWYTPDYINEFNAFKRLQNNYHRIKMLFFHIVTGGGGATTMPPPSIPLKQPET